MIALAILGSVALLSLAVLGHQLLHVRQQRWLKEFDAQQKPQLELGKVELKLSARMDELERAHRTAQYKKLG